MKRALSFCGGGIRGIVPCLALVELERQTGKLTRDCCQYVSGTSTGALLACAVVAGVPAADILKIYTERAKNIFTPTGPVAKVKRLAAGYMYAPLNLRGVLASILGTRADWTLNDCPIGILISATSMNGHNWFFTRDGAKNARTTGSASLVDAAVASAAAPTFHDHWRVDVSGKTLKFFDGSVGGLANPSYEACVEMFEFDDFTPSETRMRVLGTGYFPASDDSPSGLFKLIDWSSNTLVDSSSDWVDAAVRRQWPGVAEKCNPLLSRDVAVDDLGAIPDLVAIGTEAARVVDWERFLA